MLKSLKIKDAKKCKPIQQKKWFVLDALVVGKMLARVTQERIILSTSSVEPCLGLELPTSWFFGRKSQRKRSVFFCYVNRKNLDYWSKNSRSRDLNGLFVSSILKKVDHSFANITDASFLPGLHLGELAVHEQNILGNGPKVFYAFTDIWISDIIRIIEFILVDVCRT